MRNQNRKPGKFSAVPALADCDASQPCLIGAMFVSRWLRMRRMPALRDGFGQKATATTVPARANFALMFDRRRAREERRGDGLEGGLCDENANHVWGSFLPEGC
jgi:hypothetical protein